MAGPVEITDEIRRAVAAEECATAGHDLDPIVDMTGEPVRLICGRCGTAWRILPAGRAGRPLMRAADRGDDDL